MNFSRSAQFHVCVKYFVNNCRFNVVYSRDNLPKNIRDGAYVINPDEYTDVNSLWISLHIFNNDVIYFYSFVVELLDKL